MEFSRSKNWITYFPCGAVWRYREKKQSLSYLRRLVITNYIYLKHSDESKWCTQELNTSFYCLKSIIVLSFIASFIVTKLMCTVILLQLSLFWGTDGTEPISGHFYQLLIDIFTLMRSCLHRGEMHLAKTQRKLSLEII